MSKGAPSEFASRLKAKFGSDLPLVVLGGDFDGGLKTVAEGIGIVEKEVRKRLLDELVAKAVKEVPRAEGGSWLRSHLLDLVVLGLVAMLSVLAFRDGGIVRGRAEQGGVEALVQRSKLAARDEPQLTAADLAGRTVVSIPAADHSLRLAPPPPAWVSLALVTPEGLGEVSEVLGLNRVALLSVDRDDSGAFVQVALSPRELERLLLYPAGSVAQVLLPLRVVEEQGGEEAPGYGKGE